MPIYLHLSNVLNIKSVIFPDSIDKHRWRISNVLAYLKSRVGETPCFMFITVE